MSNYTELELALLHDPNNSLMTFIRATMPKTKINLVLKPLHIVKNIPLPKLNKRKDVSSKRKYRQRYLR